MFHVKHSRIAKSLTRIRHEALCGIVSLFFAADPALVFFQHDFLMHAEGEHHQAIGQVNIIDNDFRRCGDIHRREVPDALYAALHQRFNE